MYPASCAWSVYVGSVTPSDGQRYSGSGVAVSARMFVPISPFVASLYRY